MGCEKMDNSLTECHAWNRSHIECPKGDGTPASQSDLKYMGSWNDYAHQTFDLASSGSDMNHTAPKSPSQPDESTAPPSNSTETDDHNALEHYLKQSVRDEPWNSLIVQHH